MLETGALDGIWLGWTWVRGGGLSGTNIEVKLGAYLNQCSDWGRARVTQCPGSDGLSICLQPDVFPGNCWAFEGDHGQVVIRLPGRVQLSDITLQHPPPSVAHTGKANSAPRDFAVYVSRTTA